MILGKKDYNEKMNSFFIYILECSDKTLYVGKTTNIAKRLRQHNGEIKGGAKYTSGRRPVKIRYIEKHTSLSAALKREIELKKLDKNKKILLITKS